MSAVEEQNSSEESPVQVRKTDRMLTKILQKLHRLGPSEDQKVSKAVPVEENGAALSESSDNEKVLLYSCNILD
jgi:hypothetical protein